MKPEDQEFTSVATLDPGPDKVIGPGHDYGSVTDEIGGVVFRPFLKTPRQMFIGFALCIPAGESPHDRRHVALRAWRWRLGH